MKIICLIVCCLPVMAIAQTNNPNLNSSKSDQKKEKKEKHSIGLGLKGGLNFANVYNTKSVSTSNQAGFMGGVFFSPPTKSVMGYRTEIIYSKQGFNYETGTNTGNVNLDYIIMPHLTCIRITKFFQLQLGGQIAYLLNAKQDSVKSSTPNPYGTSNIMNMYNRFDCGFAGGIEIHPFAGLIIGARLNVSMGNLYKDPSSYMTGGGTQSPLPKIDVKNNVLQLSAGWIF